jgi:hypothetical protein
MTGGSRPAFFYKKRRIFNVKKIFLAFLLISFTALSVYAEGLSGIFGIEFGTSLDEVKATMVDKGWTLSKTEEDTIIFKKNKGTYASLIVDEIKFCFFNDRLYKVFVIFPSSAKIDDVVNAVNGIKEACLLTYVNDEKNEYDNGSVVLAYNYTDPNLNIFIFNVVVYKSLTSPFFMLIDFDIAKEKNEAEEKLKQEERERKNKIISSDL